MSPTLEGMLLQIESKSCENVLDSLQSLFHRLPPLLLEVGLVSVVIDANSRRSPNQRRHVDQRIAVKAAFLTGSNSNRSRLTIALISMCFLCLIASLYILVINVACHVSKCQMHKVCFEAHGSGAIFLEDEREKMNEKEIET